MERVLYLKFRQHISLRTLLVSTYPAELVYFEPRDRFWGRDGAGAGRNKLGKLLMLVRERLGMEAAMLMTLSPPSPPPPLPGQMMQTPIPSSGHVPMPTPMPMPMPWLGGGGGPVIKFNGYGEFAGLLYHSPHSVVFEDDLYPTALHLFEARKFLDHRPDLADRIRQCERVEDVTAVTAELAEFTRRDWGNIALSTVSKSLIYPCFAMRCVGLYTNHGGRMLRWTMCYISSSVSTGSCVSCFSILTPMISSMTSRETHSGETVGVLG